MKTLLITTFSFIVILTSFSISETYIPGGYISGTWTTAGSPYLVQGDITIHADSSLTIDPGVEVNFQTHCKFIVEGILQAVGTEQDSILFTAAIPDTGWRGIRFESAPDGSQLSYCIIQYGRATVGTNFLYRRGGGIYINTSRPQISHCTISNCYADVYGGGIYISAFDFPPITNCNITRNSSNNVGGGIYSGPLEISDCNISQNTANVHGGGLYLNCGATDSVHISNCIISEDSTGQFGDGGGIYVTDGYVFINGCTFANNKAGLTGGGLYSGGDLSLTNSTVQGNISWGGTVNYEIGGGGFIAYKSTFVDSCIIVGNISHTGSYPSYGGGFLLSQVNSAEITNSKILNNSADVCGGLMVIANNTTLSYCEISNNQALLGGTGGAQILSWNSSIDHCTVSGNVGGGLYVNNDADISNSIFSWNSSIAVSFISSGTIDYCNFFGNDQDITGNIPTGFGILDTTNTNGDSCDVYSNIFLDPLFADTLLGNYHLTENSPCIDAGNPFGPFDPDSTISDIGASYYDQTFPIIAVSGKMIDFGNVSVGQQANESLVIYNTGTDYLLLLSITNQLTEFTHSWKSADSLVLPGDSLNISVSFAPADSGLVLDTLFIDNNDHLLEIYLSGTGDIIDDINDDLILPKEYALYPAYPNPFNPTTTIEFDLPKLSYVQLKLFDVLGREVRELISDVKTAGKYKYVLDGSDLASGLFFIQMRTEDFHALQKILLVK